MVSGIDKCLNHSIELANKNVEIKTEEVPPEINWPFPEMWKGQREAVTKLIETRKTTWLTSPTGSGKTPIIVSSADGRNKNDSDTFGSLIIVPRKALQDQFSNYGVFSIFGKANYDCNLCEVSGETERVNASEGPCNGRTTKGMYCPVVRAWCDGGHSCPLGKCPCLSCEYHNNKQHSKDLLLSKNTVCCNAWNILMFLSNASNIFIDEADLVFGVLSNAKKLYNVGLKHKGEDINSLLVSELMAVQDRIAKLNKEMEKINDISELREKIRQKNSLLYHEKAIGFLNENRDSCFKYVKNDYIHVEIKPMDVEVLLQKYFKDKSVVLVSATPFAGEFDEISYEVPHRSAIYYKPVGKMTVTQVNKTPGLLDKAVEEIAEIHKRYKDNNLTRKSVIHCGRLEWAEEVGEKLREKGYKVGIHERGEQRATIENFRTDDSDFVCLVAAEYGIDFSEDEIRLQFILKAPYAPRDERIKALEKEKGYKLWYKKDAILKLVQASGRVARGSKFSATFILDQKFNELYKQFEKILPGWFKARLYYAENL